MSLYTIGNWTIDRLYNDSISTPKTLSVSDISYATDFSKRTKIKGRTPEKNADEMYFTNNTGASVTAPETLIYGRKPVQDVYANTDIDVTAQMAQKGGHKVYLTAETLYSGTNSVSGQEVTVPLKGTVSLVVPDASLVTETLVQDFLLRIYAELLGTSETDASMAARMLRGDLDPTK